MPFVPDYFRKNGRTFVPEWIEDSSTRRIESTLTDAHLHPSAVKPILIKNGLCLVPQKGFLPIDILIQGGKIASVGENLSHSGASLIETKGRLISPGIIDPHVHLGIFTDFETEIRTETRSALLNGVTTIGIYLGGQESYFGLLDKIIPKIESLSFCDIFIHLVILTPQQLEEVPVYYSRYGITNGNGT